MSSLYIDFNSSNNNKHPKFKAGVHVRMSKYKTFLQKATLQSGLKNLFSLRKLKILLWTYIIEYLNREEPAGTFHQKELQKTNQIKFRTLIEKKVLEHFM